MTTPRPSSRPASGPSPAATWSPALAWWLGAVALLPPLLLPGSFAQLFWFGDEWDLLDQIARSGFWAWTWQAFAENFVPLFKLLWFGLVALGGGDYRVMLGAMWLTHALNVALLGLLLREAGLRRFPTVLCLAVFGLTPTNMETLTWTVQWSAVLATTFFLWAAWWLLRHFSTSADWSWRHHGVLCALCAASALCFSRGVLTGAALAAMACWPLAGRQLLAAWPSRLLTAVVCLAPAVAVALLITITQPGGNHRHLGVDDGRLLRMVEFAGWYFGINPFHRLLEFESWGWRTTLLLSLAKVSLLAWGFCRAGGGLRRIFGLLIILDLGNAALLGLGRYHTGLPAANSSRYQYAALICTLPFATFWLDYWLRRWPAAARGAVAALLIAMAVRDWRTELGYFAYHRGQYTRQILVDPLTPAEGAIPGIPFLGTARARELVELYNLH